MERHADSRAKRLVDFVLAAFLLVLLAPVMALVAAAIKLDSPGPIFYRCRRVGFFGDELEMLKFRKMSDGAEGPRLTSADDPRLTRVGRLLTATKLDELPQLWHVLAGEMSLIGPRPEDPHFVAVHVAEYAEIVTVKPGITGLSQLAFVREAEILAADDTVDGYVGRLLPAKVQLDLLYARNRTLPMDLWILVWTAIALVLRWAVAVNRDSGRLSRRRRRRRATDLEGTKVSC
jgi:lipopolysaccharide/colanic/teichoic acid biosynthesis glycosyltransferase